MRYLLLFLVLLFYSCTNSKSVLICGDHVCINKNEAKQYFEENLTIEVQIISKNKKSSFDLVELNTNSEESNIQVIKKDNNKVVKKLSKEEIKIKKNEIKAKRNLKLEKKETKVKNIEKKKTIKKAKIDPLDICFKLEKCDIDSITDYLIKISNDKNYPNISIRE